METGADSANAGGQAHGQAEADVEAPAGAEPAAGAAGAQSVGAGGGPPQGGPAKPPKMNAGGATEVESRAETDASGEALGGSHVRSTGEAERDDHGVVSRNGDAGGHAEGAGVTDVGVTVREDRRGGSRATAHVKAGRQLEAAIRADARAAARDEVRKKFAPHKAGSGIRAATEATHRSEDRPQGGADESAAVLRMLRVAWETGGPARANALFELCFGRTSAEQVAPELGGLFVSFEERAKIHGRLKAEVEGREKAEAEARAEVEARGELEAPAEAEAAPKVQPAPTPAAPEGTPVSPGAPDAGTPLAPETGQPEQGSGGGTRRVSDVTSPNGNTGPTGKTGPESAVSDTSASQGRELPFTGYRGPWRRCSGPGPWRRASRFAVAPGAWPASEREGARHGAPAQLGAPSSSPHLPLAGRAGRRGRSRPGPSRLLMIQPS